jgi:DNA-binding response OmpR family regulator
MDDSNSQSGGHRILVVEDDAALRMALSDRLSREGYLVRCATNGVEGAVSMSEGHDLVILDVMLPGRSGFDLAREARSRGLVVPILMLTARGEVADRVVGLQFGADDYLTKPFEFIELLARIRALLRRADRKWGKRHEGTVEKGDLRIDLGSARVFRKGEPISLSSKEMHLLRFFVENEGLALTRDELLDAVWGYDPMTNTRTVDMHVARLRQKLGDLADGEQLIITVRGHGYRFGG